MRKTTVAGLLLVVAGGLLVLFAPATARDEPLAPASVDASMPPVTGEPSSSLAVMALGAAVGLVGLALLSRALRPRDLE